MQPLSTNDRRALLKELHRLIGQYASTFAGNLRFPGAHEILSKEEIESLRKLTIDGPVSSAVEKLFSEECRSLMHSFFGVMDGVADPEDYNSGEEGWWGVVLAEPDDDNDPHGLHDEFFDVQHEN